MNDQCPFCEKRSAVVGLLPGTARWDVNCPTCGHWIVAEMARLDLKAYTSQERERLAQALAKEPRREPGGGAVDWQFLRSLID